MDSLTTFASALTAPERKTLARLTTPARIQAFLDDVPYSTDDRYRSPLSVLRDRRAHCYDGAVCAAALLRRIGYPPRIVNMFAYRDDEHLVAVFQRDGHWGAVAKSNFVGLRYREPIYRTLRELVVSYFEDYYNLEGVRSLRSYTRPFNLRTCERFDWMTHADAMDVIAARLDALPRIPVLTKKMIAHLSPLDARSYQAGMVGADMDGVYRATQK
ncbi:MAG: transglutaminase-like domain-containing protein [Chloroflexota bacterium]